MTALYNGFKDAHKRISRKFIQAPEVHAQKWQGFDVSKRPEANMVELLLESFRVSVITEDLNHWRRDIPANFPWSDDHFEERICGFPLNPGVEWVNWPWANKAKESLDLTGNRFNHNYMERYWPKYAGFYSRPTETPDDFLYPVDGPPSPMDDQPDTQELVPQWTIDEVDPNFGIREEYGDLNDLIQTLADEPDTRQAYYPMFYPEDVKVKGRKPCSLGYHFILRHGFFHCVYYMRSCDFYRHWADDCYMTLRLQLHILDECRKKNPETWGAVKPGFFEMHITSLHMFINDLTTMGISRH